MEKKTVLPETITKIISDSKEPGDILLNTYKQLFAWDGDREIKSCDYHISLQLAVELVKAEGSLFKDKVEAGFLWVDKGPSFKEELGKYEIRINEVS